MACDATQLVICADLFIFSIPFGIFCAFPNRSNKLGSASIKCIYSPGRDPKWYLHSSATFKCGDEIGQHEADGIAKRIGGGMNLGAQAAFWPSQRVSFKPVFGLIAFFGAPALCWWARMSVLSTRMYSKSASWFNTLKRLSQAPRRHQRLKRW